MTRSVFIYFSLCLLLFVGNACRKVNSVSSITLFNVSAKYSNVLETLNDTIRVELVTAGPSKQYTLTTSAPITQVNTQNVNFTSFVVEPGISLFYYTPPAGSGSSTGNVVTINFKIKGADGSTATQSINITVYNNPFVANIVYPANNSRNNPAVFINRYSNFFQLGIMQQKEVFNQAYTITPISSSGGTPFTPLPDTIWVGKPYAGGQPYTRTDPYITLPQIVTQYNYPFNYVPTKPGNGQLIIATSATLANGDFFSYSDTLFYVITPSFIATVVSPAGTSATEPYEAERTNVDTFTYAITQKDQVSGDAYVIAPVSTNIRGTADTIFTSNNVPITATNPLNVRNVVANTTTFNFGYRFNNYGASSLVVRFINLSTLDTAYDTIYYAVKSFTGYITPPTSAISPRLIIRNADSSLTLNISKLATDGGTFTVTPTSSSNGAPDTIFSGTTPYYIGNPYISASSVGNRSFAFGFTPKIYSSGTRLVLQSIDNSSTDTSYDTMYYYTPHTYNVSITPATAYSTPDTILLNSSRSLTFTVSNQLFASGIYTVTPVSSNAGIKDTISIDGVNYDEQNPYSFIQNTSSRQINFSYSPKVLGTGLLDLQFINTTINDTLYASYYYYTVPSFTVGFNFNTTYGSPANLFLDVDTTLSITITTFVSTELPYRIDLNSYNASNSPDSLKDVNGTYYYTGGNYYSAVLPAGTRQAVLNFKFRSGALNSIIQPVQTLKFTVANIQTGEAVTNSIYYSTPLSFTTNLTTPVTASNPDSRLAILPSGTIPLQIQISQGAIAAASYTIKPLNGNTIYDFLNPNIAYTAANPFVTQLQPSNRSFEYNFNFVAPVTTGVNYLPLSIQSNVTGTTEYDTVYYAVTPNIRIVAFAAGNGNTANLLSSSNGGYSFTVPYTSKTYKPVSVNFKSNNGFAVGTSTTSGLFLSTSDSGNTWTDNTSTVLGTGTGYTISAGDFIWSGLWPILLQNIYGTYNYTTSIVDYGFVNSKDLFSCTCPSPATNMIALDDSRGGGSFTGVVALNGGGFQWINDNGNTSYAAGSTINQFGYAVKNNAQYRSIVYYAIAVGTRGAIWTNYSGNNTVYINGDFVQRSSGVSSNLRSVSVVARNNPNSTKVLAAGDNGTIVVSNNFGVTWTNLNSPTTQSISAIYFYDDNNGYIAGNGFLYVTTDGGTNWFRPFPFSANYGIYNYTQITSVVGSPAP